MHNYINTISHSICANMYNKYFSRFRKFLCGLIRVKTHICLRLHIQENTFSGGKHRNNLLKVIGAMHFGQWCSTLHFCFPHLFIYIKKRVNNKIFVINQVVTEILIIVQYTYFLLMPMLFSMLVFATIIWGYWCHVRLYDG